MPGKKRITQKKAVEKWNCYLCNFSNVMSEKFCDMCRKPKPMSAENESNDGSPNGKSKKRAFVASTINTNNNAACPLANGLFHTCDEHCKKMWGVALQSDSTNNNNNSNNNNNHNNSNNSNENELDIGSPPANKRRRKENNCGKDWDCHNCTLTNKSCDDKCQICGANRKYNNNYSNSNSNEQKSEKKFVRNKNDVKSKTVAKAKKGEKKQKGKKSKREIDEDTTTSEEENEDASQSDIYLTREYNKTHNNDNDNNNNNGRHNENNCNGKTPVFQDGSRNTMGGNGGRGLNKWKRGGKYNNGYKRRSKYDTSKAIHYKRNENNKDSWNKRNEKLKEKEKEKGKANWNKAKLPFSETEIKEAAKLQLQMDAQTELKKKENDNNDIVTTKGNEKEDDAYFGNDFEFFENFENYFDSSKTEQNENITELDIQNALKRSGFTYLSNDKNSDKFYSWEWNCSKKHNNNQNNNNNTNKKKSNRVLNGSLRGNEEKYDFDESVKQALGYYDSEEGKRDYFETMHITHTAITPIPFFGNNSKNNDITDESNYVEHFNYGHINAPSSSSRSGLGAHAGGKTRIKGRKAAAKMKGGGLFGSDDDSNDNINGITDELDEDKYPYVDVAQEYQRAMRSNRIIKCILVRRRNFNDNDIGDTHFRRCESQFMRSAMHINKMYSTGMKATITKVTYVINPMLIRRFEAKKRQMESRLGSNDDLNIVLAWHGTNKNNINSIVENNFDIKCLAKNTGNRGCYGAGIYFSEFANVSSGYAGGGDLLLCKVILGKSYPGGSLGCSLQKGYDSHIVHYNAKQKYGSEIVIFDSDQILPCYIVSY